MYVCVFGKLFGADDRIVDGAEYRFDFVRPRCTVTIGSRRRAVRCHPADSQEVTFVI